MQSQEPQSAQKDLDKFLIVKNYLTDEMCDKIVAYLEGPDAQKTDTVVGVKNEPSYDKKEVSSTHIFMPKCPNDLYCDLLDITLITLCEHLSSNYNVLFESTDMPHFITYKPGDHMAVHTDTAFTKNDGKLEKIRVEYSFLIYLNDDFEGGEIFFPLQKVQFKPQKGMLVAYPGTQQFPHGVNKVTKGIRHVFVVCAQTRCGEPESNYPKLPIYQEEIGKIPTDILKQSEYCQKHCSEQH